MFGVMEIIITCTKRKTENINLLKNNVDVPREFHRRFTAIFNGFTAIFIFSS